MTHLAGCTEEWFESVSAWRDGEASIEDARRVEAHVASCAACRRAVEVLGAIGSALRQGAPKDVPERLRARASAVLAATRPRRRGRRRVAVVVGALAAAAMLVFLPKRGIPPTLADELVSRHVQGFARERPCDFESSDPGAVAAWLHDKLGYDVEVRVPHDAELLGARACRIDGVRTAAVMLRRGGRPLTIFVPPRGSAPAALGERFAGDGVRCASGPLGNAICARHGSQTMLAVAEVDPTQLAGALSAP